MKMRLGHLTAMLNDTPIPDELRLVEHDAIPFHASQKATGESAISRAANERKSGEARLPMSCQPTSFFFGLDGRIFDDEIQAERLVCRDDDLLMRKRWVQPQEGKGGTSLSRRADKLFSFVLPWCICTLKMLFVLDSSSSFHCINWDKRLEARRRAVWASPDRATQQVRPRDSCGCFRLGLACSWPSWQSSEQFCLDDLHQEMHVSHTRQDDEPSPISSLWNVGQVRERRRNVKVRTP